MRLHKESPPFRLSKRLFPKRGSTALCVYGFHARRRAAEPRTFPFLQARGNNACRNGTIRAYFGWYGSENAGTSTCACRIRTMEEVLGGVGPAWHTAEPGTCGLGTMKPGVVPAQPSRVHCGTRFVGGVRTMLFRHHRPCALATPFWWGHAHWSQQAVRTAHRKRPLQCARPSRTLPAVRTALSKRSSQCAQPHRTRSGSAHGTQPRRARGMGEVPGERRPPRRAADSRVRASRMQTA